MPVAVRTKRIVHQKAKGPIDPGLGAKVRELRTARGMTQAALAGPDFSKGFISLLETGRTRISLRAAHVLAARLGVEVTDLLAAPTTDRQDLEFMLLRAEQELRAGHHKVAGEIAATWTKKSTGILRARFQRLQARALIESARSPEAVKLLDEAVRAFRSLGAKEFVARTLYDLARAHARLSATGEGIRYALDAEHAIARGDVIDRTLELEIHQFLAGAYQVSGDVASASIRAERAREMAEDAADPRALANLYQSLALTRYQEGDKEAALAYGRKSIDLFETLGQTERVAETWNTLGWIFIQREQYAKSAEALDKAERIAVQSGLPRVKGYVDLNRGALALARGQTQEARNMAETALKTDGAPSRLRARALLLRAKAVATSDAALPQVKRAFEEAIDAHKDELPRERARAHQAYADALDKRKQPQDAFAEARKALELIGPKI
jgi:tetratricopeptide (TPR) repeat protein/DNA-binding XRE family transcriptional regulator